MNQTPAKRSISRRLGFWAARIFNHPLGPGAIIGVCILIWASIFLFSGPYVLEVRESGFQVNELRISKWTAIPYWRTQISRKGESFGPVDEISRRHGIWFFNKRSFEWTHGRLGDQGPAFTPRESLGKVVAQDDPGNTVIEFPKLKKRWRVVLCQENLVGQTVVLDLDGNFFLPKRDGNNLRRHRFFPVFHCESEEQAMAKLSRPLRDP